MTRKITFCFILIVMTVGPVFAKDLRARTEDGRQVLLKGDGTWRFVGTGKAARTKTDGYERAAKAQGVYKAKGDKLQVWYDPRKWKQQKEDDAKKVTFSYKDGDLYGMVIAERIEVTPETLRQIAIKNATSAAPDARIVLEENRTVNGKKVLCMIMEGTIEGISFVYYSYYYAGSAGTIQLITYTSKNLFAEYKDEMAEFLNGLTIIE